MSELPEGFLQKTIKIKTRTLKPYEKKFIQPGEFRYDVPIQTSIPFGHPTVCYARNNEVPRQVEAPIPQIPLDTVRIPANVRVGELSTPDLEVAHSSSTPEQESMSTAEFENAAFFSTNELYIHLLKLEKAITIFPGVNGPGSVLVLKDFCQDKQKLQKEKWTLIERKPATFNDGQTCWVYWCSCNHVSTRQISSLDSILNTSQEDFSTQYPDCIHLTAARKIYENYDHINSIVPSTDINCRLYQDHDHYTIRSTWYRVPDSKLVCCYAEKLKRFGLVELKNKRFLCITCQTYSCQHSGILSENFDDDINLRNFMDEMDVRNDEQRNKYQPKLLSYKKILYHVSDHLKEGLHQLKKNKLELLLPEDTTCRHCGSQLDGGDPVENEWVAYDSCLIVTNTDINYAKAYYRPCTSCGSVSFFEGQSKCLLNCGTFLVGYDVLRSYMHSFLHGRRPLHTFYETFCDVHGDYGNTTVREVFSYQQLRYAWLYFMDLLDINFSEGFSCPECGGDDGKPPTMLICDGTSISFQRRMWQWDDLKKEPVKKLNVSSFKDRLFIGDHQTRKLMERLAADGQYVRGKKLKSLEKNEREKLFNQTKEISVALYQLLKQIEDQPLYLNSYKKLLLSLASPSPVCSYIHPTKDVQNTLKEIYSESEIRQNPLLVNEIHKFIPIIFEIIEAGAMTDSLKLLLNEMWNVAIDPFVDSLEDEECNEEIIPEEMSFFPSLNKIRNRGIFEQDKKNVKYRKDVPDCSKTYRGHPSLLPGIFTIFCPHGVCYGFQVMQTNESPDVPFSIFRTRFKTAPKYIIYDNACKLHAYCISRDPQFFKDTEFYVDRLHWDNHTSCSYGYKLSLYPQFSNVNSQLSEQSNAGLKRIKDQLSYMTANNFMKHCTFYLWKKNKDKQTN